MTEIKKYLNNLELVGVVKWEPKVFPGREEGQRSIMVFALEYHKPKSTKYSVFHVKVYGDLVDQVTAQGLSAGDEVYVSGPLIENKWLDKKTDQWNSKVEVWPNTVQFVSRVSEFAGVANNSVSDDDIPF